MAIAESMFRERLPMTPTLEAAAENFNA